MSALTTFRDMLRLVCPWWLRGAWGERYLYSMALHLDAAGDAVVAGVKSRFPGLYSSESLPVIGRERRILRGPLESDESYVSRLTQWRAAHRRAGNPFVLLEQLRSYLLPSHPNVWIELITRSGRLYAMANNGDELVGTTSWNWDPYPEQWSRFWVILHNTTWGDGHRWGDGWDWGDGTVWGCDADPAIVTEIRNLVSAWTPPHAKCENIILVLNETVWAIEQPSGDWHYQNNRTRSAAFWGGS